MASYHHFTIEERKILAVMLKKGFKQIDIARELGKSQSTISREINRNKDGETNEYKSYLAQNKYIIRRQKAAQKQKRIANNPFLRQYIVGRLKDYWSPEQIAGRIRLEYNIIVCHETIYKYIYTSRPDLKKYLRCASKGKYRRRYGTKIREKLREKEKFEKRSIDLRPSYINQRQRIGDWEGDTIVGSKNSGRLLVHTERKSGYVLIDLIKGKCKAVEVKNLTVKRFSKIPNHKCLTTTYDRGTEFFEFEMIEKQTKMKIYFAHPYHAWERGTCENTNGLIRQFFPKKMSFDKIGLLVKK